MDQEIEVVAKLKELRIKKISGEMILEIGGTEITEEFVIEP